MRQDGTWRAASAFATYAGGVPGSDLLLVIGSNPPSQTSGTRTLNRADLAREVLGFERVRLVNLFALPSYRSGGLSELGGEPDGWLAARPELEDGLGQADAVLLAYGATEPSGAARGHFRAQVAWLHEQIERRSLPTWWVGGAPRHPSRWQRYTWREHPDLSFREGLPLAIARRAEGPKATSVKVEEVKEVSDGGPVIL